MLTQLLDDPTHYAEHFSTCVFESRVRLCDGVAYHAQICGNRGHVRDVRVRREGQRAMGDVDATRR